MSGYSPAEMPTAGKILYRAEEAAAVMSLSRTAVFGLIKSGDLMTVKIGSRRRIPRTSIERYIAQLAGQATSAACPASAEAVR